MLGNYLAGTLEGVGLQERGSPPRRSQMTSGCTRYLRFRQLPGDRGSGGALMNLGGTCSMRGRRQSLSSSQLLPRRNVGPQVVRSSTFQKNPEI